MNYSCSFKIIFEWYRQYLAQASCQAGGVSGTFRVSDTGSAGDYVSVIIHLVFYKLHSFIRNYSQVVPCPSMLGRFSGGPGGV